MEKSDPVFVPEWLKNNANGKQEGGSSSLQSDDAALSNDHKDGRMSRSVQPTSPYFRRSYSSNSSHLRSYSSFDRPRGQKGMYQNRDNDKYPYGSFRRHDKSNPLDGTLPSKFDKDRLRRSQSMFTGKQNETWLRKGAPETNNNEGSIGRNGHNATAPRNIPSLDVKEIGAPRGERIQLPGSSTAAVQGPQTNHESSGSDPSAISLDTEKTLAQGPTAAAATRSPAGRQRLEELAIIQSRQLIPVTPSLPKTLFPSHTEKNKFKIMQQQHHSSSSSQLRGGHSQSKAPRTSNVGKLLVLKPSREKNGEYRVVSPTEREDLSPIDPSRNQANNSNDASSESKPTTMEKKTTSQARSRHDFFNSMRKKSSSNTHPSSLPENLDNVITTSLAPVPDLSIKTITNVSMAAVPDDSNVMITDVSLAPVPYASNEMSTNVSVAAVPSHINEAPLPVYSVAESLVKALDDIMRDECAGNESMDGNLNQDNDEEELAFLRSLGWKEHVEEDDVITTCLAPVPDVALAAVPSHNNDAPLPVYSVGESLVKALDDIMRDECAGNESMDGNLNRDNDEEELAFLRSLGWQEHVEEDDVITTILAPVPDVALAAVPSHNNDASLPDYPVGESSVKAVDEIVRNECAGNESMDGNLNQDNDEKELAFLRSLGWEGPVEDECLTEEEINAFYEMYMKLRPSEALEFQQKDSLFQ